MRNTTYFAAQGLSTRHQTLRTLWSLGWTALLFTAALAPRSALSTPYASSLTNNAGTISFRLNEAASSVKVIWNGGANVNELGALTAGLHEFNLGVAGSFEVSVFNSSPAGFVTPVAPNRGGIVQISEDGPLVRFLQPRGIAVNTDPVSPYFGRVYVANATAGAITNLNFAGTRTVGDGIYMLNSDLSDALGLGDTASTAGLDFATGGAVSPYRLSLGIEGNLYVTDWSDLTGSLYVTDPDVSGSSGANVLGGPTGSLFPVTNKFHGSIAAAVVTGSLISGDLAAYVIDEDLQPDPLSTTQNARNSLWRHDIGSTLPGPETMPMRIGTTPWITFASQTMDLSAGPNGNFYVNDYRSAGTDRAGLYVLDSTGAALWNSLQASRDMAGDVAAPDLLRATGGGAVSPRGDYVAVINIESNGITVLPLINGIPDLTNRLVFHGFAPWNGPQGRDLAFDAAGNLYALSQGANLMRVFSPGGTTTAITGSEGTFTLIRPAGVSIEAVDPLGSETGPDNLTFRITREGDLSGELVVSYTFAGTATEGTDYTPGALMATIPAGEPSVDVTIAPLDDTDSEFAESVVITLSGSPNYDLKAPIFATGYIADNDPAVITISAVDATAQEAFPVDTLTFRVSRRGDTNSELFVSYATTNGTAMAGADYDELPIQLYFEAGIVDLNVVVTLKDDQDYEGTETACITIVPDFDPYTVGTPGSACGNIIDNERAPAVVLFQDSLNTDTSASWIQQFGANNGILDAQVAWAFDYSTLIPPVPPAPNSSDSSTIGLQVKVNKDATASAAGINFYPAGQSFSGNYALQFDMFLNYGSAGTTEHAIAGLNHSSQRTNRVTQTADTANTTAGGDGVFVSIETDASNSRDYTAYTFTNATSLPAIVASRTAASLTGVITSPPYSIAGSPGRAWSQVEVRQVNGVIALSINNNLILQYTNTTAFTSGNVMIGHTDQFSSIGSPENFVIFDNVRVIRLDFEIRSIQLLPDNKVQIDFVSPLGGSASTLRLQSSPTLVPSAWETDLTAEITATADGFRAITSAGTGDRFFRITRP